jgi:hypothetical protein
MLIRTNWNTERTVNICLPLGMILRQFNLVSHLQKQLAGHPVLPSGHFQRDCPLKFCICCFSNWTTFPTQCVPKTDEAFKANCIKTPASHPYMLHPRSIPLLPCISIDPGSQATTYSPPAGKCVVWHTMPSGSNERLHPGISQPKKITNIHLSANCL